MPLVRVSPFLFSLSGASELNRPRIFLFPHAGGNPSFYEKWSCLEEYECFVITWPSYIFSLPRNEVILKLVEDILPLYTERPSAMFGHSAGSIIAWATSLEIIRRGLPVPLRLFCSASDSPCSPVSEEWKILLSNELSDIEKSRGLLKAWNGTPDELLADEESLKAIRSRVGFDLSLTHDLIEEYKYDKIRFPLSFLYGEKDETLSDTVDNIKMEWKNSIQPSHRDQFTSLACKDGHHFYFGLSSSEEKPNFKLLCDFINRTLLDDNKRLLQIAEQTYSEWNSKTMTYPSESCLHDLFIAQAEATPKSIAIVDGDREMSFERVHYLSDLLAKWLYHKAEVRPNEVTGILMERSAEFILSYIAALKAGGGYMPLEIVYPADLLARVMEESKPRAVLSKDLYSSRLPHSQCFLNLDDGWEAKVEAMNLPGLPVDRVMTKPDDLAYIVMSSGTTGIPKGICCPHRGAVHSYYWRHEKYPYAEQEREAANIFFVWECLRPLLKGFPCYVIPDEVIYEPFALADFLERNEISRILFTPSCCQLVLDSFEQLGRLEELKSKLRHMKIVWLCGEVVTVELSSRFTALLPNCELLNLYSISECHDISVGDLRKIDIKKSPKFAPCGKVMENVEVFVYDEKMSMVPIGMAGEVYVGGPCVGIGYLNRPEQTAKRFVTHKETGKRLYRTGDRGKLLYDGTLEILGRCDFMVKIRGYSVVLGAVEVAIASHPLLSTSVVVTEGEEGTDKRLVAYLVPKEWGLVPSVEDIRDYLKDQLPHYAIPACFVPLAQLPLHDASGKLDRKQLPAPDTDTMLVDTRIIEPLCSDTQKKLASLWCSLLPGNLSCERISLFDNFFDLGGHSLLSMRLITSIKKEFNISYPLKHLLQSPVLSEIATTIDDMIAGRKVLRERDPIHVGADIILEDSIYPAATRKAGYSRFRVEQMRANPHSIFLTGATGFLGAFLLSELLTTNNATSITCLVRADTEEEGKQRIWDTLDQYNLLASIPMIRRLSLSVVVGDLGKPLLGLSNDLFIETATKIDCIIHCGAIVNLVLSYDELKKANVYGTREILRLATTNGIRETSVKPVHYISTNSVFPWVKGQLYLETDRSSSFDVNELADGYSQSKWAAEQLCIEARSRGLPVAIYRPGNLSGSSTSGVCNENDFIFLLLQSIRVLDISIDPNDPAVEDWKFDLTPIDWAASTIIHLAVEFAAQSLGDVFHIQTPHDHLSASTILSYVTSVTSSKKCVPLAEWREIVENALENPDERTPADLKILQKLSSSLDETITYISNSIVLSSQELNKRLEKMAQSKPISSCPAITNEILHKYAR